MLPALCPYCSTPLIVDNERVCRNHLCMQACAELARGMLAGEQGDIEKWRRHYRREQALIAEREQELRKDRQHGRQDAKGASAR